MPPLFSHDALISAGVWPPPSLTMVFLAKTVLALTVIANKPTKAQARVREFRFEVMRMEVFLFMGFSYIFGLSFIGSFEPRRQCGTRAGQRS
jgi:asparagine N-glycosylation enzyme membrane subunit Stt3